MFHIVTVATTIVLLAAVVAARLRRPQDGWRIRHLRLAQLSYLMLVLTFVAQFFDRLPLPGAALNAIVFLQVPMILGFALIVRSERRYMKRRWPERRLDSGPLRGNPAEAADRPA